MYPIRLALPLAAIATLLAMPPAPVAAQETVAVSLTEFAVAADPGSAGAGPVTFQVSNDGSIVHDLLVIRTDLAPDALPLDEDGFMVDEERVEVVASSAELGSGQAAEVSSALEAGSYVLICNIPTHYQAGMWLGFPVTLMREPTATPPANDGVTTGEPTAFATQGPGLPGTGQGTHGQSPRRWTFTALAAAGVALAGLGAAAHGRARQRP